MCASSPRPGRSLRRARGRERRPGHPNRRSGLHVTEQAETFSQPCKVAGAPALEPYGRRWWSCSSELASDRGGRGGAERSAHPGRGDSSAGRRPASHQPLIRRSSRREHFVRSRSRRRFVATTPSFGAIRPAASHAATALSSSPDRSRAWASIFQTYGVPSAAEWRGGTRPRRPGIASAGSSNTRGRSGSPSDPALPRLPGGRQLMPPDPLEQLERPAGRAIRLDKPRLHSDD